MGGLTPPFIVRKRGGERMAKRKITKRWLLNSFGIILLILIAIEILSAYGLKSYYYSGVRQTVVSRADF